MSDTEPIRQVDTNFGRAITGAMEYNSSDLKYDMRIKSGSGIKHTVAFDTPNKDSFERLRVSNPRTIFDSKQIYDNQPLIWDDQEVSGSGTNSTHSVNTATTTLSVSASTAGKRVRRTFRRFNYQPGKSQQIIMSGRIADVDSGITKSWGYFDDNNGIFFSVIDGVIYAVVRSSTSGSPVDTSIPQSSWNIDKLDGTGASGITIDHTKTQIFYFDFSWLGSNTVRFGFIINNAIVYVHKINFANELSTVYMSTPNLPLSCELENDGTGGAATLEHICSTVISEAGDDQHGIIRHVGTENNSVTLQTGGTTYGVIFIRLKTTHQSATFTPEEIDLLCTSGDNIHYELILEPTIGGNALSWASVNNCAIEFAVGDGSQTITNGTPFTGGYFNSQKNASGSGSKAGDNEISIGSNIAGASQILCLGMMPIGSGTINAVVYGNINYRIQA